MRYPAHLVGGVLLGVTSQHYLVQHLPIINENPSANLILSTSFLVGSVFGSLLPDIDHRGSYLGRRLPLLSWITNIAVGHRGATHAPFINVFFTTILAFGTYHLLLGFGILQLISLLFLLGCMIGAFSHIFLDALTKSGVPLLYPFSKRHFSIGNFRTGSVGETLFTLLMILFIVWFVTKVVVLGQ